MPFATRLIEIEQVSNGFNKNGSPASITSDKAIGVDRQTNLIQLQRLVKTLYGVVDYSADLFADLAKEAESTGSRIVSLANRVEAIKGILPKLEKKIEDNFVHHQLLLERIECAITLANVTSAVTPSTRSQFVTAALEKAAPPPALDAFDLLRSDGKRTLESYTNPNFLLQDFAATVQAELSQKHISKGAKSSSQRQTRASSNPAHLPGSAAAVPDSDYRDSWNNNTTIIDSVKPCTSSVNLTEDYALNTAPTKVVGAYEPKETQDKSSSAVSVSDQAISNPLAIALSQALLKKRTSAEAPKQDLAGLEAKEQAPSTVNALPLPSPPPPPPPTTAKPGLLNQRASRPPPPPPPSSTSANTSEYVKSGGIPPPPPPPPPAIQLARSEQPVSSGSEQLIEPAVKPAAAVLKPVETPKGRFFDARSELLADIRVGAFKLRKIEDLTEGASSSSSGTVQNAADGSRVNMFGNLASSKAAALTSNNPFSEVATILARRVAVGGSSSDEEDADSGEDDWN